MVVRYELAGMDLADVRFAVSPFNEMVLSLRAWRDPGRYPLHLRWSHLVRAAKASLDGQLLLALTNERLWTPDFLNPRPHSPLTRVEDEFARIARTRPDTVDRDLRAVHPRLPAVLRGPPMLPRILAALKGYWRTCFAPHWPRMQALLEADITYRGRILAQHGLAEMFAGLAPTVDLADNVLTVRLRSPVDYTRPTNGGLTLVPTAWTVHASTPISADEPPLILYGARGVGTLWEAQAPPAPGALTGILGTVRAGLLVALSTPASSTELAVRLGVTTTAVNQHLRTLRAGGLLVSARYGRAVLYHRSDLGDQFVESATSPA